MNKKIIISSFLLLITVQRLSAAKLILPTNIQKTNIQKVQVNKENVSNIYQNEKIKNIKTLKQLKESLNEIEKILQQKKLFERKKQLSKEEKEQFERKRREKILNQMQENLQYQQKSFEIEQKKNFLKKMKFKNSSKYINTLISVLKQKISSMEKELKTIKIKKEYPIKVYNTYSVGNLYYGYVSDDLLKNIVAKLKANENLAEQIQLKIKELKDNLKLINKKIINANPEIFTQKLLAIDNPIQNISKINNEINNIKTLYLKGQIQIEPKTITMSIYKNPDIKNLIKIKEGDMITDNIQVKKIINGYAIIGLVE